jgi:CBS domain-containing protein
MIEKRIHRVWVSDDVTGSRRGVGVVSMTDVMRVVFNAEMN